MKTGADVLEFGDTKITLCGEVAKVKSLLLESLIRKYWGHNRIGETDDEVYDGFHNYTLQVSDGEIDYDIKQYYYGSNERITIDRKKGLVYLPSGSYIFDLEKVLLTFKRGKTMANEATEPPYDLKKLIKISWIIKNWLKKSANSSEQKMERLKNLGLYDLVFES